jgi:hypothetical protein
MRKTKLGHASRKALLTFADRWARELVPDDKLEKVHSKAQHLVLEHLTLRFPASDMKVLARYGLSKIPSNIGVFTPRNGYVMFPLTEGVSMPTNVNNLEGDLPMAKAVAEWNLYNKRVAKAVAAAKLPYTKLIRLATYLEDVTKVWPEAEGVALPADEGQLTTEEMAAIARNGKRKKEA